MHVTLLRIKKMEIQHFHTLHKPILHVTLYFDKKKKKKELNFLTLF